MDMQKTTPDRYILHCLFGPEIVQYHRNLVNEIAQATGLKLTQVQGLSAHFTVKYYFSTTDIEDVEASLQKFCSSQRAAPVLIEGVGHFNRNVVFLNVHLSEDAKAICNGLNKTLSAFEWMQWDTYDGDKIHFHMTVAENCAEKFDAATQIALSRARTFQASFDNITILRETEVRDGIDFWEIHRVLPIRRD